MIEASGQDSAKPGWWVDSAKFKARGVTRNREYDAQSGKLVRRLRRHFEET